MGSGVNRYLLGVGSRMKNFFCEGLEGREGGIKGGGRTRGKWYGRRSNTGFIILQCSVTCGNGVRTRTVECTGGKGKCNNRTQPHSTARCYLGSCPEWNVGTWSQIKAIVLFPKNEGLWPAGADLVVKAKSCALVPSYFRQKTYAQRKLQRKLR